MTRKPDKLRLLSTRLTVKVGEHRHVIKEATLELDVDRDFGSITLAIYGPTYSQVPVRLDRHLSRSDAVKLRDALNQYVEFGDILRSTDDKF